MLLRAVVLLGLMPIMAFAAPKETLVPVLRLYRDFAWEAVIDAPTVEPGFLSQPVTVWARYFSPRLVKLLQNERQCVSRTGAICKLDFNPIWASQDPGAARLKVAPGGTPASVDVSFDYPGNGERIGMKFLLVRSGARWLIDDIQYRDGQRLAKILGAQE